MIDIAALRENYTKGSLNVSDVSLSPIEQFQKWFDEAVSSELLEPNALLLSTVSANGKPSARIVLLKGLDNGFKFYTNYLSRKGTELIENRNACITFLWGDFGNIRLILRVILFQSFLQS